MKKIIIFLFVLFSLSIFAQVTITMEQDGGVYKVPCVVNGAKMKFIFDTGAATVCLSESMAEYLLDNDYITKDDILGTGTSQVADGRIVDHVKINLRDIEVAGLHLKDVEAVVVEGQRAPLLLGQTAIQKLGKVSIDGNKLIIENGYEEDCVPDGETETISQIKQVLNGITSRIIRGRYKAKLAHCYYYGKCTPIDYSEAARLYRESAECSNIDGMIGYANCLYFGRGVQLNYNDAIYWFKKAAEYDDPFAFYCLGWMYRMGQGVEVDMIKGFEYARLAVEKSENDFSDARSALVPYFEYFLQLARENNTTGFFYSGYCYAYGYGTTKNLKEASYMYQRGADAGDAACMNNLANMYENGNGVSIDKVKAISLFQRAAELGDWKAQENLGKRYYWGMGVERDYLAAYKWFNLAVSQGSHEAEYLLGTLFYYGWGVQQDYSKAFQYFSEASSAKKMEAVYYLGNMYRYGYGVEKDISRAIEYYESSSGDGWSDYALANIYKKGENGQKDYGLYRMYMQKCWEDKFTIGMNELAYDYAQGRYGTKKDIVKALQIINEAIELDPADPNYYDSKGEFFSMQGKYNQAKEMWLKAKALDSNYYTKNNTELNKYIKKQVK